MVGTGLRRVVRRARQVRVVFRERVVRVEREVAVHLARRHVVKALHAHRPRDVEQGLRPENVRPEEAARIDDCERVVRLGREVDDDVDLLVAEDALGEVAVRDVPVGENDPVVDVREARAVAGVRQQVVRDDVVAVVAVEPPADEPMNPAAPVTSMRMRAA